MKVCTIFGTPYPETGTPLNVFLHIFLNNFKMDMNIQIIFPNSFYIHEA